MLTTGEAIGLLRAIEYEVLDHCSEFREHHEACTDILKYIDSYIELIDRYEGIPTISDMYPTIHVTMYEDSDTVPTDPDEYLKREV